MSEIFDRESQKKKTEDFGKRDAETYMAIGIFIMAVGIPVLLGTMWALDRPHAAVVNAICGAVLCLIGAGCIGYGWLLHRRQKQRA
ncbi:MAG: hypothetical protein KA184_04695 [Candidatus Hydrogenedentes bacterium]|nr:hypothetical protein [Candidatus Hydrogenedentota bacterium]